MLMGVAVAIVIFVLPETIQTRLEIQGQQIGVYGAVSVGVRALGSLAAVHVLQNFMSDPAIAAVTLLSGVAANVIEGLAGTTLVLYMCALFASVAVMESLCSLASNSMFNSLYQATVGSMRGAVFLYTAGIVVLCFLLVLVFMRVTAGGSSIA
nr:hypothetical protein BaRGS_014157 [Batillaria attramentaria]